MLRTIQIGIAEEKNCGGKGENQPTGSRGINMDLSERGSKLDHPIHLYCNSLPESKTRDSKRTSQWR
jgi:hypothetical protein